MRLIDSDALFHDRLSIFKDSDGEHYIPVSEVVKMIQLAPTVDAIPTTYLRAWLDNACEQDDIPMIHALDRILKRWERTHFSASEETENS